MYRYKSLEGEYFCNKDFAKKTHIFAYDLCIAVVSLCFLSVLFCFICKSLTPCLLVAKGPVKAV